MSLNKNELAIFRNKEFECFLFFLKILIPLSQ